MFEHFGKTSNQGSESQPAQKHEFISPEKRKVTPRSYETYLKQFDLSEDALEGKHILDIGAGLSDFSSKANEKFKESGTMAVPLDPVYAFFGGDFQEFKDALGSANLESGWTERELFELEQRYHDLKSQPNKIAGSHQQLPFKEKSMDLVLAHNSITQYKDREITRHALDEMLRSLKEHGEIRIVPVDMLWDQQATSWYLHTFEPATPEGLEEMRKTGMIQGDPDMFSIFRALEEHGVNFYLAVRFSRVGRKMQQHTALVIRTDQTIPHVEGAGRLEKLSFGQSHDQHHVPSERIPIQEKNDSAPSHQ